MALKSMILSKKIEWYSGNVCTPPFNKVVLGVFENNPNTYLVYYDANGEWHKIEGVYVGSNLSKMETFDNYTDDPIVWAYLPTFP